MIIKTKYSRCISIGMLFIFMTCNQSYASDESKKAEVDAVMINAAKQGNEQLVGTKVDEYTKIRFIGFDKKIRVFIYLYSTNIMSKFGAAQLNSQQKIDMDVFHLNKTCGSKFRPLMKNPYNLKISHEFEDMRTGKTIYKITIGDRDCA